MNWPPWQWQLSLLDWVCFFLDHLSGCFVSRSNYSSEIGDGEKYILENVKKEKKKFISICYWVLFFGFLGFFFILAWREHLWVQLHHMPILPSALQWRAHNWQMFGQLMVVLQEETEPSNQICRAGQWPQEVNKTAQEREGVTRRKCHLALRNKHSVCHSHNTPSILIIFLSVYF